MLSAVILFFAQWLTLLNPTGADEIWFRRTYSFAAKPSSFHVAVACSQPFAVYADGRRISNATVLSAGYHDLEVKNPMLNSQTQIAIVTSGNNDAAPLSLNTDGSKSPRVWVNVYGKGFSYIDDDNGALCAEPCTEAWRTGTGMRPCRTIKPTLTESNDSIAIYEYPQTVRGIARITLRGLKEGEKLYVNGRPYTATGKTDEQYIDRGSIRTYGAVVVKGREPKKRVNSIEIQEIQ